MLRVRGWEQRLSALAAEAIDIPHGWGVHDCVTFAADCVRAITGVDLMGDLRGTYDGPVGAARVMREQGADTLGDLPAIYLPVIPVWQARRGDIVLCAEPYEFLAVCVGRTAVGPSETGMIHILMDQAVRAYRVGE
jgi:hypothetical protein